MNSLYLSLEEELELLEKQLNLPQMYIDLGKFKGAPLSPGQQQMLHLKLTGYDTDTIADYLGKKPKVITVEYSRSLRNYVEDLLIHDGLIPEPKPSTGKSKVRVKANWVRFILLLREKYRRHG